MNWFRDFDNKTRLDKLLFFIGMVALFFTLLFFTSCGVLKKEKTTETKQTEIVKESKDSTSTTETNKAIKDNITINVPKSDNKEVQIMLDDILRRLNTSKSSGDNSYKFYYDEKLRQLQAEFNVAKTENISTDTNQKKESEKTFEQNVEEYKKKIVTSWWTWLIVAFLLRKQIFGILSFIFPPLRTISQLRSLRDVITPPGSAGPGQS